MFGILFAVTHCGINNCSFIDRHNLERTQAMSKPHIAQSFIDPVCMMEVKPTGNGLCANYRMKTFYFCAPGCREAFVADPEKYTAPKPAKPPGWWGRYLNRLNKTTGGKAQRCH